MMTAVIKIAFPFLVLHLPYGFGFFTEWCKFFRPRCSNNLISFRTETTCTIRPL